MIYPTLAHFIFVTIATFFAVPFGDGTPDAHSQLKHSKKAVEHETLPPGLVASDWSGILRARDAAARQVVRDDDGYVARNRQQHWSVSFDGVGFITKPEKGTWSWGLQLKSYGVGEHQTPVAEATNVSASGTEISYKWNDLLTEWYKNESNGLEHGYTLQSRPSAESGELLIQLNVRGDLYPKTRGNGADVTFMSKEGIGVLNYGALAVYDAKNAKLPARFETKNGNLYISIDDRDAKYPITVDPLAQQVYVKASNTGVGDFFAWSISVSGDTVAVGATEEGSNATGINGDQSNNSSPDSGAVYIFVRNAGVWTQEAYIKASNTNDSDWFGEDVAISGNTLVVGAPMEDSAATGVNGNQLDNSSSGSGAAYVFVRDSGTWSQQAYLKASNTGSGDNFGYNVDIYGDTIVVAAPFEDSAEIGIDPHGLDNSASGAGAVYVFVRNGTTWTQESYIKASNTNASDIFGASIAIFRDTLVVGAVGEDSIATGVNIGEANNAASEAGAAYVFVRNAGVWSQEAYLKASNTESNDQYGQAVAVWGDTVVVTAIREDSNATGINGNQSNNSASEAGAAYVYTRSGTTWTQQAYVKASNTGSQDKFGTDVALWKDMLAVSAYEEASNATGINGNQSNNAMGFSGAVYLFKRSGTTWTQQAYIKASNTDYGDLFGYSVDISGDLLVIGAVDEESNATGINGDQTNNTLTQAGAAYFFDIDDNPGLSVYGTGTPGCSGTQTLDVTHSPMINSPRFAISCNNAPPLSLGLGLVTDSQDVAGGDPFTLGVLLHSDFAFATEILSFDFYSDASGYAETVGSPIPNDPTLVNKTFYASALWAWTSCVLPGFNPFNLSTSRGLAMTIQYE